MPTPLIPLVIEHFKKYFPGDEYLKRGHEKISAIQEKEVHVHIEKTRIYYFSGKCKQTNKKQVALLFLYES